MVNINLKSSILSLILLVSTAIPGVGQLSSGGYPVDVNSLKSVSVFEPVIIMPAFKLDQSTVSSPVVNLEKSIKFAHSFEVELNTKNAGKWFEVEGKRIWQLQLKSEGAKSVGLIFSRYYLPEGARLFVFDPQKDNVYGAFTARNNKTFKKMAIYPLPGDELIIQYEEPFAAEFKGELEIAKITHDYIGVVKVKNRWKKRPSGSCNVDVNCESGFNTQNIQRSVIRIFCDDELGTATLINNTAKDGKPLILSAYHIFDKPENAEITLYDFNYESPFCTNMDGYDLQSISGSTSLASFDSLDFVLAELSEIPPASFRPYYAGWDASGEIPAKTYTIHHPNGDVKKISVDEGVCDSLSFSSSSLRYGHWKVFNWESGTTEAGSSGAGLFGKNQRLYGTLSGGEASCDKISYDAFARFDRMWKHQNKSTKGIKHWLDARNTGVLQLDGFDPYAEESLSCTVVSNYKIEDELVVVDDIINTASISEVAEKFSNIEYAAIAGVAVGINDFTKNAVNAEIILRVYTGVDKPDIVQKQYRYSVSELTKNAMNYFDFGEELEVEGSFYISVVIANEKDTISLYQSNFRGLTDQQSMYVYKSGLWSNVSEYSPVQDGASLLMQVNICKASYIQDVDTLNDKDILMQVYPNPVSRYLTIEFMNSNATNVLTLADLTGKVYYCETYKNRNYIELDVSILNPGIYLLNLINKNKQESKRIIVY